MSVAKKDKSAYKTASVSCSFCHQEFKVFPYRASTAKFCSVRCKNKMPVTNQTKKKLSDSHKGQIKSEKAHKFPKDELHPNWSGDNVSYRALHRWVEGKLGKPKKCNSCESKHKKVYHWANKSGQYNRDVNDWLRLCVPCHSKYDRSRVL